MHIAAMLSAVTSTGLEVISIKLPQAIKASKLKLSILMVTLPNTKNGK
jgi:hypothetical protein